MANPRKSDLMTMSKPDFFSVSESLDDFEAELAACRYAFGGAGVSAIERTSLGIPSTVVSVAENQRLMAEHLGKSGVYRYLGISDNTTEDDYVAELQWLAENWHSMPYRLPPSDIDGQGANRVVDMMEQLLRSNITREQMTFRTMQASDLSMVRKWRNTPSVRERMFNQHEISAEEHERWFASISGDTSKRFFIVYHDNAPIGMVSFTDIDDNAKAEWGFYKSPDALSGIGNVMLSAALAFGFEALGLSAIESRVLCNNHSVIHLHNKLGFTQDEEEKTLQTQHGDKQYFAFFLSKENWQTTVKKSATL